MVAFSSRRRGFSFATRAGAVLEARDERPSVTTQRFKTKRATAHNVYGLPHPPVLPRRSKPDSRAGMSRAGALARRSALARTREKAGAGRSTILCLLVRVLESGGASLGLEVECAELFRF